MVEVTVSGGVARIFLNRPEKVNALDAFHLQQLKEELKKINDHPDVRVVVLGGHGRAFCGGADVEELKKLDEKTAGGFVNSIHLVCQAIRALPVPVVARLHGAVIGAGLEIAAACDMRIAAEGTKFAMPEVRLAIPSVVEAALLPRLMGAGRAARFVLTGEVIDAQKAYEWGLVEEVSSDLDQALESIVQNLLAADAQALKTQKELIQLWEEAPLAQSIAVSSERFAEAYRDGMPARRLKKP